MVVDGTYLYLKIRNKTKTIVFATSICIILEILGKEFRKEKEIKDFQTRKEEVKFYLFVDA